jgi:hypothetical protein
MRAACERISVRYPTTSGAVTGFLVAISFAIFGYVAIWQ